MFQELTWDASCNPLQDFFPGRRSIPTVMDVSKLGDPDPKNAIRSLLLFLEKYAWMLDPNLHLETSKDGRFKIRFLNDPRREIRPQEGDREVEHTSNLWNHPQTICRCEQFLETKNGHVFCVQKPLIRLGSRDDHHNKTRMYDVSPYNSKNFPLNGLKPPILLHCNLETICEGCCAWSGTQDLRCSQLVTCGEMKPKWISMRWKKCSQIGNWFRLCTGPEPGGMYFPKNLEFYWGASGDWTWRHFCKKDMHWPRWIKISTYSPIQATDCQWAIFNSQGTRAIFNNDH